MKCILEIKKLNKSYKVGTVINKALHDVSLSLSEGELLVIMGRSGSGKTTLLNLLGAMDVADSGTVIINGNQMEKFFEEPNATLFRRENIGFVFQQFNLLKDMSARENIALPLIMQGVPSNEIDRRVEHAMNLLEIESIQHQRPNSMSGGQQQRVAIARAIITEPPILLADEPTGNLDYATTVKIMEAFLNVIKIKEQSSIIVTHDPKVATYADRIIFIHDGSIFSEHSKKDKNLSIDFILSQLKKLSKSEVETQ